MFIAVGTGAYIIQPIIIPGPLLHSFFRASQGRALAETDWSPVFEFPSKSEGKSVLKVKAVIMEKDSHKGVMISALNSHPS